MNRNERIKAGLAGSIENAVDDVRHTYERVMWGDAKTNDVHIFNAPETEQQDNTLVIFDSRNLHSPADQVDDVYSNYSCKQEKQGLDVDNGVDID